MHLIIRVPGVVAQFIQDYLVGRKVMRVGECADHMLDSQQEYGLGYLVAVHSVFPVADGRDSEDEVLVRKSLYDVVPSVGDIFHGQQFAPEFPCRVLVAKEVLALRRNSSGDFLVNEPWW